MQTINDYRIKIFCRSFDLRLYERSKAFYAPMHLPMVRLTDQSADGYFYSILAHTDCDIAINVDEDCFIANPQALLQLVDYVVANNFANAGCPDGGGATPRNANPIVTNPFFNIFNLRLIRATAGDATAIRKAVGELDMRSAIPALQDKTLRLRHAQHLDQRQQQGVHEAIHFQQTDTEPYYPFFFWLASQFDTLYLPSRKHPDGWTTMLYTPVDMGERQLLCAHAWLARFYSVPAFIVRHWQPNAGKQQQRIDALIAQIATQSHTLIPTQTTTDSFRYAADKILRWIIKVPQRIAGWPRKLYRKCHR